MRRLGSILLVAVALAALALAGTGSAKPRTPPPGVAGTPGEPPPAWFAAGARDGWLAYGSFCWRTACVDFLPPDRRTDVPPVRAPIGSRLSLHLGFAPRWVRVRMLDTGRTYALVARRDTGWRVRSTGLFVVEARGAGGSASYLGRIVR